MLGRKEDKSQKYVRFEFLNGDIAQGKILKEDNFYVYAILFYESVDGNERAYFKERIIRSSLMKIKDCEPVETSKKPTAEPNKQVVDQTQQIQEIMKNPAMLELMKQIQGGKKQ